MRFLCLHGMGTNASILEAQMSSIVHALGSQHEFVSIDGEVDCDPAYGIERFYPGPYFCFYDLPTKENIEAAFELLDETIEQDGPFDGIIGFSQGAALASSYLLHKSTATMTILPFKCAVFMCASMPFDLSSVEIPIKHNADFVNEINALGFSGTLQANDRLLQRYDPTTTKSTIPIPTFHIVGNADMYFAQGCRLAKLCTPYGQQLLMHSGGHELPRDRTFARKAVGCFEQMMHAALMG